MGMRPKNFVSMEVEDMKEDIHHLQFTLPEEAN